ncbi:MAG: hypothetical protein NTV52_16465 [Acidobacteria bacterium]|nr:hypothetical protein [Acidobacteriota bacterium]
MGPHHRHGIARRIEQTSDRQLVVNHGTLEPGPRKLEHSGLISTTRGLSPSRTIISFQTENQNEPSATRLQ